MPLTERERRIIAELERQLEDDTETSGGGGGTARRRWRAIGPILGAVMFLAGLLSGAASFTLLGAVLLATTTATWLRSAGNPQQSRRDPAPAQRRSTSGPPDPYLLWWIAGGR